MLNSVKAYLFSHIKSTGKEQKEHYPFNIDLDTRNGFESEQIISTQNDPDRIRMYQKNIDKLPMPPVLWDEFQRATKRGASSKRISTIITSDPVLSSVILKTVNSPSFGLTKPIVDLKRAISHLGSNLVRGIVAKHCFSAVLPQKSKAYNIETLWKHGMAVSALAEIVGAHIPECNKDEAATIGLFHDIGRMGFNFFGTHKSATFDHEKGYLHYESRRFGCTHIEMGELFAKHWKLPEKIQLGIKYHHHPGGAEIEAVPESIRPEVFAVYLADLLAKHLEFHGGNTSKTHPHESYAGMLPKITLYDIMHKKAVSKELWRVNCIDF